LNRLLKASQARATTLLKEKEDELHRLAHALVEHETLNLEEVRKVIRGEPIRDLSAKLLQVEELPERDLVPSTP